MNSDFFYFSSEIKQLRAIGIGKKCNYDEISIYLYTGCANSSKETFFEGIFSLDPGHSITIKNNGEKIVECWYDLSNKIYECKKDINYEEFYSILEDSINLRLRSDVKIGSALSGGIDSSSLLAMVMRNKNINKNDFDPIHAKSSDPEFDESYFALEVSKKNSVNLNIVKPSVNKFKKVINEIVYLQDEPFPSTNIFMQYFLMKHASKLNCKVMIDGQGADEILLGYSRLLLPYFLDYAKNNNLLALIKQINLYIQNNKEMNYLSFLKYTFGYSSGFLRTKYMKNRMNFIKLPLDSSYDLYKDISSTRNNLDEAQVLDIKRITLPQLLRTEDRNSMGHSIEARVPFLDYRLVEYCLNLKYSTKIKDGWTKYALRRLSLISDDLAWRKSKLGYDSPQLEWSQNFSREMFLEVINSNLINKIADIRKIKKRWNNLYPNEKWRLFNLSLWQKINNVYF